jgi:hypothetical protein
VRVEVLTAAGGGAPWLDSSRFADWFDGGEPGERGLVLLIPLVLGLGKVSCEGHRCAITVFFCAAHKLQQP